MGIGNCGSTDALKVDCKVPTQVALPEWWMKKLNQAHDTQERFDALPRVWHEEAVKREKFSVEQLARICNDVRGERVEKYERGFVFFYMFLVGAFRKRETGDARVGFSIRFPLPRALTNVSPEKKAVLEKAYTLSYLQLLHQQYRDANENGPLNSILTCYLQDTQLLDDGRVPVFPRRDQAASRTLQKELKKVFAAPAPQKRLIKLWDAAAIDASTTRQDQQAFARLPDQADWFTLKPLTNVISVKTLTGRVHVKDYSCKNREMCLDVEKLFDKFAPIVGFATEMLESVATSDDTLFVQEAPLALYHVKGLHSRPLHYTLNEENMSPKVYKIIERKQASENKPICFNLKPAVRK